MSLRTFFSILFLSASFIVVRADVVELYTGKTDNTFTDNNQPYFLNDTITSFATLPNGEKKIVRQLIRQRDSEGHLLTETSLGLSSENGILNEQLTPYSVFENSLDSVGRIVKSIRKQYDSDVNLYFDYLMHTHRYDDDGSCIMNRYHKNTRDEWVLADSLRISATFNDDFLPVEILIQTIDSATIQWTDSAMITLQYDSLSRTTDRLLYLWNGLSWNLQSQQRYNYTSRNLAEVSSRIWSNGKWRKPQYSLAGHQVKLQRQSAFGLYSKQQKNEIENKELENKNIIETPKHVPTKKGFYINAGSERVSITIFNAKGRQLYNRSAKGITYIDFSPWGKGNYSLRITQNGRIITRRIRID